VRYRAGRRVTRIGDRRPRPSELQGVRNASAMWVSTGRNGIASMVGVHIGRPQSTGGPLSGGPGNDPQRETQLMTEERDTVVVDDTGGSSMGAILGVIAIIVLLVAVWYFALGPGASSSGTTDNGYGGSGTGDQPAATQDLPQPVGS